MKRAASEKWTALKRETDSIAVKKIQQKTASVSAENAVIGARIRQKLLMKLEKEVDALPKNIGSETLVSVTGKKKGGMERKTTVWNLRQLAGAYRDLMEEEFKREKLDLDKQKIENESW